MAPIPVEPAGEISEYDTPEAAIAAAENHPLQTKARADGSELIGSRFVDAWCDSRQCVLEFTGPIWLHVFVSGSQVDWQVIRERPSGVVSQAPIVFEWGSGAESITDCGRLAAIRRGAEFWQLWAGELGLMVYLKKKRILRFYAVRRRDTGEGLLTTSELD